MIQVTEVPADSVMRPVQKGRMGEGEPFPPEPRGASICSVPPQMHVMQFKNTPAGETLRPRSAHPPDSAPQADGYSCQGVTCRDWKGAETLESPLSPQNPPCAGPSFQPQ